MNFATLLTYLTVAVGAASARTVFSEISVNGVSQGHGVGIRLPSTNDPIKDIYSTDIICNKNFIQPVSQAVIPVVAGDTITAQCHRTPAGLSTRASEPLDPTKKGPAMAYLAAVPDATQTDVTGLKWFKIWEDGYNSTTHQWGSDHLFISGGQANITIPTCVPPGQYLLRIEYISLLNAKTYPGAEFYMSCAQLSVKASGAATETPSTVSFPGAYQSNDPGILTSIIGIYDYFTPGPFPFTC